MLETFEFLRRLIAERLKGMFWWIFWLARLGRKR
jgi:hypothetical protein